jgi:hypothetical protein
MIEFTSVGCGKQPAAMLSLTGYRVQTRHGRRWPSPLTRFLHRSRRHALSCSCIAAHCSSAGLRSDLAVPSIHGDGLHGLAIPLRTVRGQDDTFLSIILVLIEVHIHCRVSLTHKSLTPVTLEPKDTLKLTFQVVDKETGKGVQPHQTFLRFYDENTHEEGIQPIRVTPGGKAKFELVRIYCSKRRSNL